MNAAVCTCPWGRAYGWLRSTWALNVSKKSSPSVRWITTLGEFLMGARSFSRSSAYSAELSLERVGKTIWFLFVLTRAVLSRQHILDIEWCDSRVNAVNSQGQDLCGRGWIRTQVVLCGLCHCDVAIALQGHVNVIRGHLEADKEGQMCLSRQSLAAAHAHKSAVGFLLKCSKVTKSLFYK